MTNGCTSTSEDEQLLPGLLDDIVVRHVVPKLPWRAFHILSLVSRRWREANQSRRIYDSRVRSLSTETLFVLNHTVRGWTWDTIKEPPRPNRENAVISLNRKRPHCIEDNVISLYSMRDDSWHLLPQFPKSRQSQRGIPRDCQCISLHGKIYVLGGRKEYADSYGRDETSEVYVLDLAGQKDWEKCASMPQPRRRFGCGVVDEKIYVFGGFSCFVHTCESIVYDPTANVWSSIKVSNQMFCDPRVFGVGKELFVQKKDLAIEVYHTEKDEWRTLEPWRKMERNWVSESEVFFTAKGKLHRATPYGIHGHDNGGNGNTCWTRLHSFMGFEMDKSFPSDFDELSYFKNGDIKVLAGNDELLALVSRDRYQYQFFSFLYRSIGFNSENGGFEWKRIGSSKFREGHQFPHIMCPIQI